MKKLLSVFALVLLFSACADSPSEIKAKCTQMLDHPLMSEYYQQSLIDRWRKNIRDCNNDPDCLDICYREIKSQFISAQLAKHYVKKK